jgi:amidase
MVSLVNTFGGARMLKSSGITRRLVAEGLSAVPFTQLANLAGQPAASLPLHWTIDGLPCGVMISAPIGDDATVLRLAAQIEASKPWFDRKPVIGD